MTTVMVLCSVIDDDGLPVYFAEPAYPDPETNVLTPDRSMGDFDVPSVVTRAARLARETGRRLLAAIEPGFGWDSELGTLGAQVGEYDGWPVYELVEADPNVLRAIAAALYSDDKSGAPEGHD